jgi:hypothetical protein
MSFPKHEPKKTKTKKPAQPQPQQPTRVVLTGPESSHPSAPSMQHDINHITGLADIEESLDWIARGINKLTSEEHPVNLVLAQGENTNPIQITLAENIYEDTLDRLVTAFERIADSVARLAGLTRPRLESWHEQADYEPRYKDMMSDGGAPGPKTDAA